MKERGQRHDKGKKMMRKRDERKDEKRRGVERNGRKK